ncbi:CPBP family intramembrane glutamic endopeptidase [Reichenbachiella sp. 5M10]|uniref:CPBP family intramembrane glutamic endopeptidase n=1 Tax=Reichenbachiella sp. 5M10 TaxID=1889772 RepID=UPI0013046524|nr:CPBP family intramembrane glutamic endopeptidase [Reichenbachiella sp. 5M10]
MTDSSFVKKMPLLQIPILIGYAVGGLFIGQFLSLVLLVPLSGMGVKELLMAMQELPNHPELKGGMLMMQFVSAFMGFVVGPFLYIHQFEKQKLFAIFRMSSFSGVHGLLVVGTVLSFIVVDSVVIEWNADFVFPEPFQSWAKGKEEVAAALTKYLTTMDSVPYFVAVFVIVAILPAIGEELLFRGLIQKYFVKAIKNPHLAIWLTAVMFSAFHMQFFGFFPRMLLGALFGYFYYYSGNLLYAILAHFVNNGLTIVMLYLYQQQIVDYDIENTESIPLESVGIFAIIGIVLFVLFTKQFKESATR